MDRVDPSVASLSDPRAAEPFTPAFPARPAPPGGPATPAGRRRRIVFVGNCQASAFSKVYRDLFSDGHEEEVVYLDDLGLDHQQLRDTLAGADTIVAIERDFDYGLQELRNRPGVAFLGFPMVMGGFLWPYATEPHPLNVAERPVSDGPYPTQRSDSYLNRLIAKGVSPEDALDQYLRLDVARVAHPDRFREIYLDQQRARDARTGFDVASFIDAQFAEQALFMSPQHPNAPLFNVVATQLFERMGVPPARIDEGLRVAEAFPFPREELPIHPAIVRHFGLRYVAPDQRYRFNDEATCTFAEYVLRYMRFDNNPALRRGIYLSRHDPANALAPLDEGLAASPDADRGWRARGAVMEGMGRHGEALEAYARSTELAPAEVDGWLGLARAAMAAGRPDEALALGRRMAAEHPLNAFVHQTLAELLARAGDPAAAAVEMGEATRLLPGSPFLRRLASLTYVRAGLLKDAEAELAIAMRMEPGVMDHVNLLAEVHEEQNRRGEALALLQRCRADGLFNDQTFSLLGHFNLREGDLPAAEDAFAEGAERFGAQRPDLVEGLLEVRRLRAAQAA